MYPLASATSSGTANLVADTAGLGYDVLITTAE